MEIGFRGLFLSLALLVGSSVQAASDPAADEPDSVLIEPKIERIEFEEARIDARDYEIALLLGYISIEDFGVQPLLAVSMSYFITENIFAELRLGQATAGKTSYEVLTAGAPLLTDAERDYQFYSLNIGYHLLPGEAFVTRNLTYNTAFYLSGGIGNTDFAGSDRFTINYGAGYRFLFKDWLDVSLDFRNSVHDMDLFGELKTTNNLQFTLGFGLVF